MSVAFKPTRGRILVKQTAGEQKTASGLILPSNEKENRATVIKIGEGVTITEGSVISYRNEAGRNLSVNGEIYMLLYEADIDGIYE